METTDSALVGSIRMIECVNIEPISWDLFLKIFLLHNVFPKLAGVLCTRHATRQAYNGGGVVELARSLAMRRWSGGDRGVLVGAR